MKSKAVFYICAMAKEIVSDYSQTYVKQTPKQKGCNKGLEIY